MSTDDKWIIMKASRAYRGGIGYTGPTCANAGIEPGQLYSTQQAAERDAALLSDYNPVGFTVEKYRNRPSEHKPWRYEILYLVSEGPIGITVLNKGRYAYYNYTGTSHKRLNELCFYYLHTVGWKQNKQYTVWWFDFRS
jgi:hypothetical protein